MKNLKRYYTIDDLSKILKSSTTTVKQMVEKLKIPTVKCNNKVSVDARYKTLIQDSYHLRQRSGMDYDYIRCLTVDKILEFTNIDEDLVFNLDKEIHRAIQVGVTMALKESSNVIDNELLNHLTQKSYAHF